MEFEAFPATTTNALQSSLKIAMAAASEINLELSQRQWMWHAKRSA